MTARHQSHSAENHGSDHGTQRLKGAHQLAIDDAARSAWLDVQIRTPSKAAARNQGRAYGRTGGRRSSAGKTRRAPTTWTCGNCGVRNRAGVVCGDCRAVKMP